MVAHNAFHNTLCAAKIAGSWLLTDQFNLVRSDPAPKTVYYGWIWSSRW